MRTTDTVALIVDPDFGVAIREIAAAVVHTWVVDTEENCAVVEQVWKSSSKPLGHMMQNGITTFRRYGVDRESWCDAVLDSIEDHHDRRWGNPGYSALEVYGTPLSEQLHTAFSECGFSTFIATSYGFRAEKSQPTQTYRCLV